MILIWITPSFQDTDGQFPFYYYLLVLMIYAVHQVAVYSMFVAVMAFFAKVCLLFVRRSFKEIENEMLRVSVSDQRSSCGRNVHDTFEYGM